jgi:hypothetical protein
MATTARWQEWAGFFLGLWLAVSPWVVGYVDNGAATANAAFVGLALALASHFEASFDEVAGEWLNLGAGLWLLAAPFLLGFFAPTAAAANCLAVGACVTGLAASALQLDKGIARLFG